MTSYLQDAGFSHVEVLGNRLLVTADATVGQASKAFHTSLSRHQVGARTVYANMTVASVPTALAGVVQAVIGLNDVADYTPHVAKAAPGSPKIGNVLAPSKFITTYDAVGTPTGANTSLALLTEGKLDGVLSDLKVAEAANRLPTVTPKVIPIGVLNDPQIVGVIDHFVADNKAQALSASIGGCDLLPYADGSMSASDIALQEGAMQGQSMFASSGDNGSQCGFVAAVGVPAPPPGTNWPASGTFTTAVGGTSLLSDVDGNRVQEFGWVGSGGGSSEVEASGTWTQASNPTYTAGAVAIGGRAVPDISLDADPNLSTSAEVYVNGKPTGVGGTSLASPMALGFWSRLESAHANRLGLASVAFYRLYDKLNPGTVAPGSPVPVTVPATQPKAVPGFTDIIVGNNGGYTNAPGYDEVTGLGVLDVKQLMTALD